MKSLYGRQFLLTAGMILISFALLGTSFIALTYRYTSRIPATPWSATWMM